MGSRRNPNWLDLPQCIVEIILNKLHFVDQTRALAVCKTWRDCKDNVTCSDRLPWVISHQPDCKIKGGRYSFVCELIDPYSRGVVTEYCMSVPGRMLHVLASKLGWLLLVDMYNTHILHNPFTDATTVLPYDVDAVNKKVAMKANLESSECEIFISSMERNGYFRIRSYCVSNDDDDDYNIDNGTESVTTLNGDEAFLSMFYMDGNIYILFDNSLHRYALKDKSWKLLTSGFPEPYESLDSIVDGWLIEIKGNLMAVRLDIENEMHKWMLFRFDWSAMSWVVESSLKSCAIFISDNVAFTAPLTNNRGEILEDCMLFYLDEFDVSGGNVFKCYSPSDEGWKQIEPNEYEWIRSYDRGELWFIEPPYFGI